MPNHVTNYVIISGVSDERLAEILSAVKGVEVDEDGNPIAIDFNRIVPMPPTLMIESSSIGEIGHAYRYPDEVKPSDIFYISPDEIAERFEKFDAKTKKEALRLADMYHMNYINYGATNWYDWACENWGTKWNAYWTSVDGNTIRFCTAWSTPYALIQAMSEKFPDADFRVEYSDEDIGQNCGWYEFKGGEAGEEYVPEGGSDEAYEFAIKLQGLEDTLVKNAVGQWVWKDEEEEDEEACDELVQQALDILKNDGVVGER